MAQRWVERASAPVSQAVLPHLGKPIDKHNCRLFGPIAIGVQLLMGVLVLGSLAYKRQCERPQRPWRTWMLDITKQLAGQLMVHVLNVALSTAGSMDGHSNPCSLYFLNILLDSTLGVAILYYFMQGLTYLFETRLAIRGLVSGDYQDDPPPPHTPLEPWQCWVRQTAVYVLALSLMKLLVLAMLGLLPFLTTFGDWLLGLFGAHRGWQVVFAMAIFPLAMNTLQFWLIDSILQHQPGQTSYSRVYTADMPMPRSESELES